MELLYIASFTALQHTLYCMRSCNINKCALLFKSNTFYVRIERWRQLLIKKIRLETGHWKTLQEMSLR